MMLHRRGRGSPCGRAGAFTATPTNVVLGGRATSVPFTAVLSGPDRRTTGNAQSSIDLRGFTPPQVATQTDLALQAGGPNQLGEDSCSRTTYPTGPGEVGSAANRKVALWTS
jgi:hypothetical protein